MTIPLSQKCDGNNDCPTPPWELMEGKTSDENRWLCKSEGEIMIYIFSFLLIHVTAEHNNINDIASKNDYPQNVTDTPVTIQERIKLHIIFKCIREC